MNQTVVKRRLLQYRSHPLTRIRRPPIGEYFSAIAFLLIGLLGYYQLLPNTWLAISMLVCITQRIYVRIDHFLIILELAGLIAVLQCVLGPLLMYGSSFVHHRYMMYVDAETYFSFAIPGVSAFVAVLCLPVVGNANTGLQIRDSKQLDRLGWFLFAIALAGIVGGYIGLGFFGYILAQFKYIAAICLFMSGNRLRWPVLLAVLFSGYLTAAQHGMFHELLIWGSFVGSFIFLHKKLFQPILHNVHSC